MASTRQASSGIKQHLDIPNALGKAIAQDNTGLPYGQYAGAHAQFAVIDK